MENRDSFIRPQERVLFIGDSITDAFRKPEEINIAYRLGNGYAMMVAAHLMAARPGDDLKFKNRGISGNRLPDLVARWQTDCLDLTPTVVSILIGINDSGHYVGGKEGGATPAAWIKQYRSLLQQTRAAMPQVRFILGEPFGLPVGMSTPVRLSDLKERQPLVEKLADEFEAIFVPFQSAFDAAAEQAPPEYWIYDGVHPTAAGYWIMAGAWLESIGELSGS